MSVPGTLNTQLTRRYRFERARVSNINREQFWPRFTPLARDGDVEKSGCIHRCENRGGGEESVKSLPGNGNRNEVIGRR